MTVSSNTSKAGPYAGSGTTGPFSFGFTAFSKNDIKVVRADASGAETTLVVDSDYTVSLNSDQVASPGGSITLMSALATGFKLAIIGNVAYAQTTQLPNGGAYNATTVERAIDRQVQISKQLQEQVDRTIKVTVTSGTSPDSLITSINNAASSAATSATASAASAASSLAALQAFQSQYYGASATDPTTDPLGNAMTAGDLYWNTTATEMRVYSGTSWGPVAQTVSTPYQSLSGTGAQTAFTLSSAPGSIGALEVFISGVRQRPTTDYTLSGTTLTFVTAPPSGTNNIFTRWITTQAIGVPSDATVTTAKFDPAAVAPFAASAAALSTTANTKIAGLTAPVASNALTISLGAALRDYRSATGGSGTVTTVTSAGASLVVPQGATLGMSSGVAGRVIVLSMNNGGTLELAAVSAASGLQLDESGTISTTAISAAATSPTTIYSTTARSNLAYRVEGILDLTEASAGVYATAPSYIQGLGGGLTSISSLGLGVQVQTFTGSGTWTKPKTGSMALIEAWGGGGSGSCSTAGWGGGGGNYNYRIIPLASLAASETVAVGAGGAAVSGAGANGNAGGQTSFGSWLIARGGGGGSDTSSIGGGGGAQLAGSNVSASIGRQGGASGLASGTPVDVYHGGAAAAAAAVVHIYRCSGRQAGSTPLAANRRRYVAPC